MDLFWFLYINLAPLYPVFNGVFHWLAVSHGSTFFVSSPSVFRLTIQRGCCSALAYSSGL